MDWQKNKVTADGKITEWSNPLRFYDEKSRINYTIANDRRNLYLVMKVTDESMQMKILRSGMEFRIDTSGKKTFPIAFGFPIPGQIMMTRQRGGASLPERIPGGTPGRSTMNQKLLNQAKTARLSGFKSAINGKMDFGGNTYGISASIIIDSLGILYYEAILPFSTFFKNELAIADTGRSFSYEILVNPLSEPPAKERGPKENESMEGGRPGGGGVGGGFEGGGTGGENPGGAGNGRGGGNMTGGGFDHRPAPAAENSDLYVKSRITKKMKFSIR